jgi:hypothetical protein
MWLLLGHCACRHRCVHAHLSFLHANTSPCWNAPTHRSSWSPCANGTQNSTRKILLQAANNGTACSTYDLRRTQACSTGCGPTVVVFDCVQTPNSLTTTCTIPSNLTVVAPNRKAYRNMKVVVYAKPVSYN